MNNFYNITNILFCITWAWIFGITRQNLTDHQSRDFNLLQASYPAYFGHSALDFLQQQLKDAENESKANEARGSEVPRKRMSASAVVEKPSNIEWQQNVEVVNLGSFHDAAPYVFQTK